MPQPHSLGAFGQDGQRKLIQSESCQGGTGSGKETQPHWRVQRSSCLSNISLTSTLGPPTAETTVLSAGGPGRPRRGPPLDRILDDHTHTGVDSGGGVGRPPLPKHVLQAGRRAALHLSSHVILPGKPLDTYELFPFHK